MRDRKDCRNRIHGEENISAFNSQENDEQGCCKSSSVKFDEELCPHVVLRYGHRSAKEFQHWIVFGMNLFAFLKRHLDSGKNQKDTENIYDPVKRLNQA